MLPSLPQDHLRKPETDRAKHRVQIAQLLLQHYAVIERVYKYLPKLAVANLSFPLLETLAMIALQYAAACEMHKDAASDPLLLCRILVSDYFFLSFGLSSQYNVPIEHPLRSEAAAQV